MRHPIRRTALALTAALLLSACGGGGDTGGDDAAGDSTVQVTGTDTLAFEPSQLSAAPGEVTVEMACEPAVHHTFVLEQNDQQVVECAAGETVTGSATLEAGEYVFYCSVVGHREAGMEGTLTVG